MAKDEILKSKKILAVDDEPDILETLVELLDECDMEIASRVKCVIELVGNRVKRWFRRNYNSLPPWYKMRMHRSAPGRYLLLAV